MIPRVPAPYVRGPRISGWLHALDNRVHTRAITNTERILLRQREMGLRPSVCACGGVCHTEPVVQPGSIIVHRCTGCGTHVQRD